jgi:hypothetical protein
LKNVFERKKKILEKYLKVILKNSFLKHKEIKQKGNITCTKKKGEA